MGSWARALLLPPVAPHHTPPRADVLPLSSVQGLSLDSAEPGSSLSDPPSFLKPHEARRARIAISISPRGLLRPRKEKGRVWSCDHIVSWPARTAPPAPASHSVHCGLKYGIFSLAGQPPSRSGSPEAPLLVPTSLAGAQLIPSP